jgi:hypothetical protein
MPTKDLIGKDEPIARSVLAWRLGLPFAALNFVILGLAISSVNPRAGNSSSLMIALFAFIVYYNLMTLGESWVSANKIGMWGILGLLHGSILTSACWCCWRAISAGRRAICCSARAPARRRTMKVLRNLIYREVIQAVLYVSLAFLALFFFFDLVDEMRWVGSGNAGYTATRAAVCGPVHSGPPLRADADCRADRRHLRDGQVRPELGVHHHAHQRHGPWLALRTLLILGMSFVLLTVLVGDYIAPAADNFSQKLRVVSKARSPGAPPAPGSRKSRAITRSPSTSAPSRALATSSMCASSSSTARAASPRRSTPNRPRSMKTRSSGR